MRIFLFFRMMIFAFWLLASAVGSSEVFDGQVYHLERAVSRTSDQNVFDATANDSLFDTPTGFKWFTIKYMHNCLVDSQGGIKLKYAHPARDAIGDLTRFEETGLVEKLVGYGDVDKFEKSKKVNFFGFTDADYLRCGQLGAKVKFIIVKRTGGSVAEAMDNSNSSFSQLKKLMKFGIQLINWIRSFHKLGSMHGNVAPDSVHFKHPFLNCLGESEIVMTSFEKTRPIVAYEGTEERDVNSLSVDDITVLSPWELQNYRRSRRDDVYRALELVADLCSQHRLSNLFRELDLSRLILEKTRGSIFSGSPIIHYSNFEDLDVKNYGKVEKILTDMTREVLKLRIDEKPHYNAIIRAFNAVISLIEGGFKWSRFLGF